MRMSTRGALWTCALSVLCFTASRGAGAGQGGGASQSEWTGTITITETASGAVRGAGASLGFNGQQTVTYSLNGDGTATWSGSVSSTLDMSGLYKIPTTGGGGGFGRGSVSFDGGVWTIYAEPVDDMTTITDHSAEDHVWLDKGPGRLAVEIAKALGQPPPKAGHRTEKGRFSPLGASVPMRGAANATTLSSSASEVNTAERLGGPATIPSTINYSWNLHRGPVQPHVKIYGNECGCIDGEATDTTMRFTAGAAPRGGEFSEFIVTSDGKMPDIVSNQGGEQPSLEITGTKDTGSVTLKIRYTRNGVSQESAPFKVDFCAIEKIEPKDNETDIAFDFLDRLIVDAKAKAWRGGKDVSKTELEWDIDKMGSPTSLNAEPSDKKGDHIKFTYDGLPARNSDFGEKKITAKTTGKCKCQQEETIRAFYVPDDDNHPGGRSPNWFYYWKQTAGAGGAESMLEYHAAIVDPTLRGTSIARYNGPTEKIWLAKALFDPKACRDEVDRSSHAPTGRHAEGIDCFGETIRHELQHRADEIEWWGTPQGPDGVSGANALTRDSDGDHVPLEVEARLPGCSPISQYSCKDRPFNEASDAEINAYWQGWTWSIGSANAEDWSCGKMAKQWNGKKCG